MKKTTPISLTFVLLIGLFASCKKDELPNVPIYEPGEMLFGSASGKKAGHDWQASGIGLSHTNSTEFWGAVLATRSKEGFLREEITLGFISTNLGLYQVAQERTNAELTSSYFTFQDDGDVIEDIYDVDEDSPLNIARIIKVDTLAKVIEGVFTATYKIRDPQDKVNPNNPDQVTFSDVSFSVQIIR